MTGENLGEKMVRVYRYGLLPPTENAALVRSQLRAAHRYRNTLVEIERGRRAATRALEIEMGLRDHVERARVADERVRDGRAEIKRIRAEDRSLSEPAAARASVEEAVAARREATAALREARRILREDPVWSRRATEISDLAGELRRSARAHCGVYWGSYLLIEAADEASRKMPLWDGAEPSDPRFQPWTGDAQNVGVQIQKGMSAEELESGKDTRLRLEPGRMMLPPGKERRPTKKDYRTLAMRVGTVEGGRDPIWARWPLVFHRPLPKDARIKQATVSVRRVGPREEWCLLVTVEFRAEDSTRSEDVVAVDVGWRRMPYAGEGDLRVATWGSRSGAISGANVYGHVVLPARLVSGFKKVDDLHAIRDKNFNAARDALVAAMAEIRSSRTAAAETTGAAGGTVGTVAGRPGDPDNRPTVLPEWLEERTRTLGDWRSPARLSALAWRWRDLRFEGDEAMFGALEAWRYHDRHIWEWEARQRNKCLRRRREIYRLFARQMRDRFGELVVEKFDLRPMARRPRAEEKESVNVPPRWQRHVAAVSELRLCLSHVFGKEHVDEEPAAWTTLTCHVCLQIEEFDAAREISYVCGRCGATWDQDRNACANLLRAYGERSGDEDEAGASRAGGISREDEDLGGGRWARAKRNKAQKRAVGETAREVEREAAE